MDQATLKFPWLKMIGVIVTLFVIGLLIGNILGEYPLVEIGGQFFIVGSGITVSIFLYSYSRKAKSKIANLVSIILIILIVLWVGNYARNLIKALNPSSTSNVLLSGIPHLRQ